MASGIPQQSIKRLASLPRGAPLDVASLQAIGVSASLASHYVRAGWLTRLGRGSFMFPGDQLDPAASIKILSGHLPGLHVGGKDGVSLAGYSPQSWSFDPWFSGGIRSSGCRNVHQKVSARYISRRYLTPHCPSTLGCRHSQKPQTDPRSPCRSELYSNCSQTSASHKDSRRLATSWRVFVRSGARRWTPCSLIAHG